MRSFVTFENEEGWQSISHIRSNILFLVQCLQSSMRRAKRSYRLWIRPMRGFSLLLSIIMGQSPIFTSHAMFSWWGLHAFYLDAYLLLRSLCLKLILPSACAALSSRGVKLKWRDWLLRLTQIRIDTILHSQVCHCLPRVDGLAAVGPLNPRPLGPGEATLTA